MFINNYAIMGEFIRTFIAIDPDLDAKDKITKLISDLQTHIKSDIKWTFRDNLHLTIKFLGDVSTERIEKVIDVLDMVKGLYNPFDISISQIGLFPSTSRPRIIWLGIKEGKEDMINLVRHINDELEAIGFSKEDREYTAHLTIGRVRSPSTKIDNTIIAKFSDKVICTFSVNKLILYKSDLRPDGPIYTILKEFPLKEL